MINILLLLALVSIFVIVSCLDAEIQDIKEDLKKTTFSHYSLRDAVIVYRNQQESLSKVVANLEKHLKPKEETRKKKRKK